MHALKTAWKVGIWNTFRNQIDVWMLVDRRWWIHSQLCIHRIVWQDASCSVSACVHNPAVLINLPLCALQDGVGFQSYAILSKFVAMFSW